jgi:cystathionine beta-lyase
MATTYAFDQVDKNRYPRYFNTPNQEFLAEKLAALEHAESALIFSSGMAAISTALLAFLKQGDHLVVQNIIYGGTSNFIRQELPKLGIEVTFTEGYDIKDFEAALKPNTTLIFVESPSNPLLTITDLKALAKLARSRAITTMIDNTFATPVNQNPINMGIDIVTHSATKYLGGHSDITAGVVASSKANMATILTSARNYGGNLSDFMVWMLERSVKTLGLRVKAQNRNAKKIARYLAKHPDIKTVYYPGLKNHPQYALAKSQMRGFGGMLSFELADHIDPSAFLKALRLVKPVMSLAGLESTVTLPFLTSHALLTPEQRAAQGISDQLVRFSAGIESRKDLVRDLEQALSKVSRTRLTP